MIDVLYIAFHRLLQLYSICGLIQNSVYDSFKYIYVLLLWLPLYFFYDSSFHGEISIIMTGITEIMNSYHGEYTLLG